MHWMQKRHRSDQLETRRCAQHNTNTGATDGVSARINFGHAGLASRCCMQAVCHGDARRPNSSSLAASFQTEGVEGTQTRLCTACSYVQICSVAAIAGATTASSMVSAK